MISVAIAVLPAGSHGPIETKQGLETEGNKAVCLCGNDNSLEEKSSSYINALLPKIRSVVIW